MGSNLLIGLSDFGLKASKLKKSIFCIDMVFKSLKKLKKRLKNRLKKSKKTRKNFFAEIVSNAFLSVQSGS